MSSICRDKVCIQAVFFSVDFPRISSPPPLDQEKLKVDQYDFITRHLIHIIMGNSRALLMSSTCRDKERDRSLFMAGGRVKSGGASKIFCGLESGH